LCKTFFQICRDRVSAALAQGKIMLNNVLIVDDESSLLFSIETGFAAFQGDIKIFTAKNGKAAVQILESIAMDLVVTDIRMPQMDGFELLAYLSSRFPEIPVVVMSACEPPDIVAQIEAMGVLRILEKPIHFKELVHTVQEGLAYAAQQGSLSGISVDSFLQLIEMEEKTCLLEVRDQKRQKGLFYFYKGQLYDASFGDLKGQDAAVEMITWENVRLNFKNLPGKRIKQRITTGLMSILMEASKNKDEAREEYGIDFASMTHRRDGSPEIIFRRGDNLIEKRTKPSGAEETGRKSGKMADLFRETADRARDIMIICLADMDGKFIAGHSPTGMEMSLFAARMADIMDMLVEPMEEVSRCDKVREAIVRTDRRWVACRCLAKDVYLGIMVGEDCTPGRIQRLLDEIASAMAGLMN